VHLVGFYYKNYFPLKEISPVDEELLDCKKGLLEHTNYLNGITYPSLMFMAYQNIRKCVFVCYVMNRLFFEMWLAYSKVSYSTDK